MDGRCLSVSDTLNKVMFICGRGGCNAVRRVAQLPVEFMEGVLDKCKKYLVVVAPEDCPDGLCEANWCPRAEGVVIEEEGFFERFGGVVDAAMTKCGAARMLCRMRRCWCLSEEDEGEIAEEFVVDLFGSDEEDALTDEMDCTEMVLKRVVPVFSKVEVDTMFAGVEYVGERVSVGLSCLSKQGC